MRALVPAAATLGALAVAAAACNRAGPESADHASSSINVELREWAVRAGSPLVKAGPVSLRVTNSGRLNHQLVVLRNESGGVRLPVSDGVVRQSDVGPEAGRIELDRGQRETRTFELSPGKYVLICNYLGHYQLGMSAALEVRP